tara:strand:- start:952 stop:1206 length:255 start_codon:yes stop_codon:yes gene_type:complete
MNKFLTITIIYTSFWTSAIGATVNCSGGKCNFIDSYHYKDAATHCQQTLNYEEVETNFIFHNLKKWTTMLYFRNNKRIIIILRT